MALGASVILRPLTLSDHACAPRLYTELTAPQPVALAPSAFAALLAHPGTTIWGAERAGCIDAMATLHLLPNMTNAGRPYGVIENVITLADLRGIGLGRAVMQRAIDHAFAQNAYKIMLLTGKSRNALGFYQALGFNADEKYGLTLRAD